MAQVAPSSSSLRWGVRPTDVARMYRVGFRASSFGRSFCCKARAERVVARVGVVLALNDQRVRLRPIAEIDPGIAARREALKPDAERLLQ